MICIVNNVLASPTTEPPNAAAADMKVQQNFQSESTESTGFAEKLRDCEEKCMKEQPAAEKDGAEKKDNSMPDDPDKVALYGIAGILEGFEPLSYPDSTPTNGISTEVTVKPVQPATAQVSGGTEQMQIPVSREYTGELPEEIARMLQNNEAGNEPVQNQDEILRIVGQYLDSLENTNEKKPGAVMNEAISTDSLVAEGGKEKAQTGLVTEKNVESKVKEAMPQGQLKSNAAQNTAHAAAARVKENTLREAETEVVRSDAQPKPELSDKEISKQEPAAGSDKAAAANIQPEIVSESTVKSVPDTFSIDKETHKAEAAVTKDNVIRIVDKISTSSSEGKYDFDIELKPDFLGKVSIKLTMEDGSMKVQIKAEDASVKALLSDQTSSLQTMLKEKGISVTHVDVTYESGTTASFDQARQEHGRNTQHSFYGQAEGNFESAKEMYDFYIGNSAVEFLA